MSKPLVLLTDFGLSDAYVGVMKGVILSINPKATVVDLTHGIEPQNILRGARVLKQSFKCFPQKSVFVCVVDPGVGTSRKAIAIKTKHYYFVGPDNGLMALAARADEPYEVRELKNKKFHAQKNISQTFHGRDLFAPAGAHLLTGTAFKNLGPKVKNLVQIKDAEAVVKGDEIRSRVYAFDAFGNALSGIERALKSESFWANAQVYHKKTLLGKPFLNYGAAPQGKTFALFNSAGELELARRNASAKEAGRVRIKDSVTVRKRKR